MENMPMIFQTSTLTYNERYCVYQNEILGRCKASEVKNKLADYIEKFVQKRGWKAIWSCTDVDLMKKNENLNILVEVADVFPQSLSSEINICVPVVSNLPVTFQEAQALIRERDNCIPLSELSPIFDESGNCDQTALAIEHVRFFFDNLWRDWDLDDDEDYPFVGGCLKNRLQLHYDITQNKLSDEFTSKYNATLNEYKQKVVNLKELRKNMSASDSEQELDTSDVLILTEKQHEIEDIARSLQSMEDPHMRYLLASKSTKSALDPEVRTYPVTIIVADKLTAKMVKSLADEAIVEHYTSLEKAFENSRNDDSIVIYPGCYNVCTLVFMHSLTVTGYGSVIFENNDDDEFDFIKTRSSTITFENIKITLASSNSRVFVVEKGKTFLKNCELRCTLSNGIVVRQGAELVMENCKVHGAVNVAVTIEENSVVFMQGCEILCGKNIDKDTIGVKIFSSASKPANATVTECRIVANKGICITDDHQSQFNEQSIDNGVRLMLKNNVLDCDMNM